MKAIQAKREAAKATFPDVGTNLSDVEFRDFPMYQMSLTVPEASFMNGKVKVVGVVFRCIWSAHDESVERDGR